MKTQIVYVVTSSPADLFLEELWLSVWSLRQFHPEARVVVLADAPTARRIAERGELRRMLTEVVTVPVPEEYSLYLRSRQIKTTIRERIRGAFFFLDTDTIVCRPLDGLDALEGDMLLVPDAHLPYHSDPFKACTREEMRWLYGLDYDAEYFFNSGAMLVRDTELAHRFFRRWNELWIISATVRRTTRADQPGLNAANQELGFPLRPLPDTYNCQLALSVRYLHEAHVVHFFHMPFMHDQSYSPFFSQDIYRELRAAATVTPEIAATVLGCKSAFAQPSMVIGPKQIDFLWSPAGQTFCRLFCENRRWRKFLNAVAMRMTRGGRALARLRAGTLIPTPHTNDERH